MSERVRRHRTIGPVTLYPLRCAMHGAVNIRTRWGKLCLKPPTYVFGRWWPWYAYLSPNATPWAAKWGMGPGFDKGDRDALRDRRAALRRMHHALDDMVHDALAEAAMAMRKGQVVTVEFRPPHGTFVRHATHPDTPDGAA